MFNVEIVSERTGAPANPLDWQDADGGPLKIANLPPFDSATIRVHEWSMWRYAPMLPAIKEVSLGAGMTPLVPVSTPGGYMLAKLEFLNPTGSYKDRGTAVLVNHLFAQAVTEVVEDSSGNAAASLAAYAGAAGIKARIFVPADASASKKAQIKRYGAEVVEVPGPRQRTTDACLQAAQQTVYATHAWSPFFVAGQMTCAWEIWEQMGRRPLDALVCPVGHGGLFLGLARGFKALLDAGLIDRMPRLFAAQAAACDPVVRAWEQGVADPAEAGVTPGPTVAEGIVISAPVHGREIIEFLQVTDGGAFRVEEAAIQATHAMLAGRGFYVEPTSAVAVAALAEARATMDVRAEFVVPLTGNGLKAG